MHGSLALGVIAAMLAVSTAAAAPPPAPPQFVSLTVADGLPSSVAYKTVQDREGFIWIGTQDGLARYDGLGFRVFRHDPADPASLPSNDVSALLVDRAGNLWCGGEASGLNRLEPDGRGFRHWMHAPNELGTLGSDDLFTIVEDADGAIWVGTYLGGLNRLLPDGSFQRYDHDADDPDSLRSTSVISLLPDARKRLWIGTDDGVDVLDADGRLLHVELPPTAQRPGPTKVSSLVAEPDGGVVVGTTKGLFRVDAQLRYRGEIGATPAPLRVLSMARGDLDALWIGVSGGLMRSDARGLHRYGAVESSPGAYPGARTMDILHDGEGGTWFALYDGGVARLPPHWRNFSVFRHVPGDDGSLARPRAKTLMQDASGAIWVGSGSDGLDRIDADSGRIERWGERLRLSGSPLSAVLPQGDAHVWVGTASALRRYSLRDLGAVEVPMDLRRADALPPGIVDQLVTARDGSVWVGVRGGGVARMAADPPRVLARYTPSGGRLDNAEVFALALDRDGSPWLATMGGIERHDATQDRFVVVAGVPREQITAFDFAADGSFWLHRLGALERYRLGPDGAAERMQSLGAAQGWPTLTASALAVAADGSVWVTSPRGLWRVDGRSGAIRRFDERDGLPSSEFLAGALIRAADGALYAGTLHGVAGFDPLALQLDSPPSPLHRTALDVRRDGVTRPLDPAAPVELDYDDLDFRVEARLLSYANSAANRYRVRLDGFDRDWIEAERGERIYSQLPPGDYRLRVRAANADGVWSELPPLPVRVASPPWKTPTAYALYALTSALAGYAVFGGWRARLRRRHAEALAEERRRSAEQLVDAKSAFLATMGHEIRTPMTGVLGMSELLLATSLDERQRGYVDAIRQSGELMLRVVNDSLDLARIKAGKLALSVAPFDPVALLREVAAVQKPLAERKGLSLSLDVAAGVPASVLGDALRVKQILLNLANNAFKFTERGGVTLGLARADDGLVFRVADSGPGMSEEVRARLFGRFEQADGVAERHGGSGLGLSICRELAQRMGGRIDVASAPGAGSTFSVTLPLAQAPNVAAAISAMVPAAAPRSLRVLLVEDDATVADVVVGLLARLGHRALHAPNGLAALAELQCATTAGEAGFDLALLDLDLPGLDGLRLARMIRASGSAARLPLIALTARSVGDEEAQIRAAGMDLLLRKPTTLESLGEAITAAARL
ncbi:hybrid sensor histidine kinase/response regulator [Dokdonella sp.]|uniref:hybrid sensor histidine kinase/response regulator n=1 Tax=Dokdonella sp. TaxID=2291710 RepID=UPI001B08A14C|nr:hybrid sensor histidine kinase/response regulator [Dokdonella sp.]MBO9664691.1 response regulator [Dokdonella sp.]